MPAGLSSTASAASAYTTRSDDDDDEPWRVVVVVAARRVRGVRMPRAARAADALAREQRALGRPKLGVRGRRRGPNAGREVAKR